jgi:hypothetical protein
MNKTISRVRDGFRQEFGWDFRLIRLLSLDLLHFLSRCFDEFHELVNAIVPDTNWEAQVETLVQIIREGREKMPESLPSLVPSLSPSLTETRVPPSPFPSPPSRLRKAKHDAEAQEGIRAHRHRIPLGGTIKDTPLLLLNQIKEEPKVQIAKPLKQEEPQELSKMPDVPNLDCYRSLAPAGSVEVAREIRCGSELPLASRVFRRTERTGLRPTGCSHHDSAYGVAQIHRLLLKHSLPSANGGAKEQVRVLSSACDPSQVGLVERTCTSRRNTLKQTDEIDVKGDWKP